MRSDRELLYCNSDITFTSCFERKEHNKLQHNINVRCPLHFEYAEFYSLAHRIRPHHFAAFAEWKWLNNWIHINTYANAFNWKEALRLCSGNYSIFIDFGLMLIYSDRSASSVAASFCPNSPASSVLLSLICQVNRSEWIVKKLIITEFKTSEKRNRISFPCMLESMIIHPLNIRASSLLLCFCFHASFHSISFFRFVFVFQRSFAFVI